MAHEELPIPVKEPVPVPNTGKGNSYAGSCRGEHGCKLVEIEGDRKVGVREQVLKVKTDNVTGTKPQRFIRIACGASRRSWQCE